MCLQGSSYTDGLTSVLKAGVIFVALLFSGTEVILHEDLHTAFSVSQNSLSTFCLNTIWSC